MSLFLSKIKPYLLVILSLLFLKIVLMGVFSSGYQDKLFLPFVDSALSHFNAWQYIYQNNLRLEFPYHPLMLYIFMPFKFLINVLHVNSIFWINFIFKFPILLSDLVIFYLLVKLFPNKVKEVILYYFASPIIIYASFMHSQLDLISMSILFGSVYYLKKHKILTSSVFFALACCTKLHVAAILPLVLIYVGKNYGYKKFLGYIASILFIYVAFSFPYFLSEGYQRLVLLNPKQNLVFGTQIVYQNLKIYLLPMFIGLVYLRFLAYPKINADLFDSFCLLVFSLLLIFTGSSGPAWYCWIVPFMSLFAIKYGDSYKSIFYSIMALNLSYLIFFIFFHVGDYPDLVLYGNVLDLKIHSEFLKDLSYTLIVMSLVSLTYLIYKIGVKSNSIYKMSKALCIGIVGDSASGKSTLLNYIKNLLGEKLLVLEGDGDHKWERGDESWDVFSHLNPKGNFLYKQASDMAQLKMKKPISRRDYNHTTGKFDAETVIKPKEFVLLSGLHAFYLPKIRKTIDVKIFLDTDAKLITHWKLLRDMQERGYSKEEVLDSIEQRKQDCEKYIAPQKEFADIVIKYEATNEFEVGDAGANLDLNLTVTLDSSIFIADIIDDLTSLDMLVNWEYSDDLKTQFLTVKNKKGFDVEAILFDKIQNIEELTSGNFEFEKGLDGLVQLIILRVIAQELEHRYEAD